MDVGAKGQGDLTVVGRMGTLILDKLGVLEVRMQSMGPVALRAHGTQAMLAQISLGLGHETREHSASLP